MSGFLARFVADERGATAIEYAVLIAFLGSVIVASLSVFQDAIYSLINRVTTAAFAATP